MNPNEKLTRYWRRKRKAILEFLNATAPAPIDVGGQLAVLRGYIERLTLPQGAAANSVEETLNERLKSVATRNGEVTNGPGIPQPLKRRSARLVAMVQGAAGFDLLGPTKPGSPGFYVTVGDIAHHVPAGAYRFKEYTDAVSDASIAAADFINAAKNRGYGNPAAIAAALTALLPLNQATMDEVAYDELEGLRKDISQYMNRGGAGDGSGYWPSVYVSSSTSGP